MKHQPFETWILDDEIELSEEQSLELKNHLDGCQECRQIYENWQKVKLVLSKQPSTAPAPGFTLRWQEQLSEKRIRKQKKQVNKLLFFLIIGMAISGILLAFSILTIVNPANLLVSLIKEITYLFLLVNQASQVLTSLINILPPIIPAGVWIAITTTFAMLTLLWVTMIWRLSYQGVHN